MFNQRIINLRKHRATGGFTVNKLKRTNLSQTSNPIISYTSSYIIDFDIHSTLDSDGDNYTNETEITASTDINNSTNFPVSLFNIFNNL